MLTTSDAHKKSDLNLEVESSVLTGVVENDTSILQKNMKALTSKLIPKDKKHRSDF